MMRQDPRSITFQSAYLNEIANFDLQNAFLEVEKESQLFRLFAHVSLTRDPRVTADMVPDEVWANLPLDPKMVELEEQRARLKQGKYRIEAMRTKNRFGSSPIKSARSERIATSKL
jgi:hypothetical protein